MAKWGQEIATAPVLPEVTTAFGYALVFQQFKIATANTDEIIAPAMIGMGLYWSE